jgi:hypothetical protein
MPRWLSGQEPPSASLAAAVFCVLQFNSNCRAARRCEAATMASWLLIDLVFRFRTNIKLLGLRSQPILGLKPAEALRDWREVEQYNQDNENSP